MSTLQWPDARSLRARVPWRPFVRVQPTTWPRVTVVDVGPRYGVHRANRSEPQCPMTRFLCLGWFGRWFRSFAPLPLWCGPFDAILSRPRIAARRSFRACARTGTKSLPYLSAAIACGPGIRLGAKHLLSARLRIVRHPRHMIDPTVAPLIAFDHAAAPRHGRS